VEICLSFWGGPFTRAKLPCRRGGVEGMSEPLAKHPIGATREVLVCVISSHYLQLS
jgi:hypothetical protein